ncbi:LTA synthase family protein [Peptoniphilus equinus]|uniref:LTA synthase family protein n=1 Tax=Peptoniphilus equinus TaxID=3016343 RepID=A0ABY7QTY3_9FIRM|nr:LTA synthase family protein [Peptoniphilus equinus]WBW49831.1 LTA synthase family protein [Peptoniphilus equinus]
MLFIFGVCVAVWTMAIAAPHRLGLLFKNWKALVINSILAWILVQTGGGVAKGVAIAFGVFALAHRYKVMYREEPLRVEDAGILKEAADMGEKYALELKTASTGLFVLGTLVILALPLPRYALSVWTLVSGIVGVVLCLPLVYDRVGMQGYNLRDLERFESRGFLYSLIHSAGRLWMRSEPDPDGELMDVNYLVIMLESFKDFTGLVPLHRDPYVYFHQLAGEGSTGALKTQVYGGGTFLTETQVLTGKPHPDSTSGYLKRLKRRGYRLIAQHPYKGRFYHRDRVYRSFGFESFKHYDNTYHDEREAILDDATFFQCVVDDFKASVAQEKTFSFSVTYQNHGPYPAGAADVVYVPGHSEAINGFNHYLEGIERTSDSLHIVVEGLRSMNAPCVLVLFGDHSPSMGKDRSLYRELGRTMDPTDPCDVTALHTTPYVIWNNFGHDFGPEAELSPWQLLSRLTQKPLS